MHDHAGHEDHTILFEQIAVVKEGVTHDLSNRRAESVVPEDFLEDGPKDGTIGFQCCDVEASEHIVPFRFLECGHDFGDLFSAVAEDCVLRVDVVKHPSHCADGTGEGADEIDDFETRYIGEGDVVLCCTGVSGLSEY